MTDLGYARLSAREIRENPERLALTLSQTFDRIQIVNTQQAREIERLKERLAAAGIP